MQRVFENLIFGLILFLFAFIPLYPKFPLFNVSGTFVAVRIEDILIALTVLLWGIYLLLSSRFRIFLKDKLNLALLLFFFIGIVSTFSAIFLTHTVISHIGILHFFRRVEFMMLMPVAATVVRTRKQFILTLVVLGLVVLAVNLYALGQQNLDWPVISTANSEFSKGLILRLTPGARVNSTFAGHYDLAVFLAMAIVILTALFFAVRKIFKIPVLILIGLSGVVLIMTAARLSFVAALVGIITALILSKKREYILLIVLFIMAFLIYPSQLRDRFFSTVTINIFHQGQRYEGRTEDQRARSRLNIPTLAMKTSSQSADTSTFATSSGSISTDITPGEPIDTTQLGVYRSFQIRLNIEWPRAIAAFIKNPLLGTGYSSLDIATDNDFLRSLGEVGILGTMALILVLIEVTKRIRSCLTSENKLPRTNSPRFSLISLQETTENSNLVYHQTPRKTVIASSIHPRFKKTGFSASDYKLIRYFSAGVLSMLAAFAVNGLFIDVFEASKVASLFWMTLGLNLAALKIK